jgi:hypothetical protein
MSIIIHISNPLLQLFMLKRLKIQIKKACRFRQAALFAILTNFFSANCRLPVGIYPTGHHQLPVFLRLICLITPILNQFQAGLSRRKK